MTVFVGTLSYITVIILNLETPKWLLYQGRTKDAIRILNYIAWFNGVDYRVPKNTCFVEVP